MPFRITKIDFHYPILFRRLGTPFQGERIFVFVAKLEYNINIFRPLVLNINN